MKIGRSVLALCRLGFCIVLLVAAGCGGRSVLEVDLDASTRDASVDVSVGPGADGMDLPTETSSSVDATQTLDTSAIDTAARSTLRVTSSSFPTGEPVLPDRRCAVSVRRHPRQCRQLWACGRACPAGAVCSAGICQTTCTVPGTTNCAGGCVNLATSAANCGACGRACVGGQQCVNGACACTQGTRPRFALPAVSISLPIPQLRSVRQPSVSRLSWGPAARSARLESARLLAMRAHRVRHCVRQRADQQRNCGACGNACPAGATCVGGMCACPAGLALCGNACVDVGIDELNCGACGRVCPPGQTCTGGTCACPGTLLACPAGCVDEQVDNTNCGGCGIRCTGGTTCESGACVCPNQGLRCGGVCTATQSDPQDCGGCNVVCPAATPICSAGVCSVVCGAGQTNCSNACVDLTSDELNCGACNRQCSVAGNCVGGACQCSAGQVTCGTTCTSLQNDPRNCGCAGGSVPAIRCARTALAWWAPARPG